jgi:FkbM family methyltransferase
VPSAAFESYAQNGEDVVLWRALSDIPHGRYVDVGANHPTDDSVSRAFYERGWRGIAIEPVRYFAELFHEQRPEDLVVEAAITDRPDGVVILHEVPRSGLSTLVDAYRDEHARAGRATQDLTVPTRRLDAVLEEAGWDGLDIQFVTIDTEGSEAEVLRSFDLRRWRPWVLVIEATVPNTCQPSHEAWEGGVLDAGYELCLFDGLSRFYVSPERAAELGDKLRQPANVLDNYTTREYRHMAGQLAAAQAAVRETQEHTGKQLQDLRDDLDQLRAAHHRLSQQHHELAAEHSRLSQDHHQLDMDKKRLTEELEAVRATLSWRLTGPLRAIRRQRWTRLAESPGRDEPG